MHGCGKVEDEDGNSYWGDNKEDNEEGYGTELYADGNTCMGQFMQGKQYCYIIKRWPNGDALYGYLKEGSKDGDEFYGY